MLIELLREDRLTLAKPGACLLRLGLALLAGEQDSDNDIDTGAAAELGMGLA